MSGVECWLVMWCGVFVDMGMTLISDAVVQIIKWWYRKKYVTTNEIGMEVGFQIRGVMSKKGDKCRALYGFVIGVDLKGRRPGLVLLLLPLRGDFLANALTPFEKGDVELLPGKIVVTMYDAHDVNVQLDVPAQLSCLDPVAQIVCASVWFRGVGVV